MEEGNSLCIVERGATRDIMVAAGVGEGFKVCGGNVVASGVVCSSLEAWLGSAPKHATQPHDHLALSSTRVSEMENGSFSALRLFKRPPGSMVLQRPC